MKSSKRWLRRLKNVNLPADRFEVRKLGEVLKNIKKYEKGSMQYQLITRKLAIFIASSNAPNSLVENEEFRSLIQTLYYRYDVPPRAQIGQEIDQILLELKGNIQSYLVKAQKVNICANVWTKKGMTSSYLGLPAHFFLRYDHRRHVVTLAVRLLPHPHTADSIKKIH